MARQMAKTETTPEREAVSALHELLLAFRAGLPGMVWLTGHDLYGVTHATLEAEDNSTLPPGADPALMASFGRRRLYTPSAPGPVPPLTCLALRPPGFGRGRRRMSVPAASPQSRQHARWVPSSGRRSVAGHGELQ